MMGVAAGGWVDEEEEGRDGLHEERREERLGGELSSGGEVVRVEPEIEVEETRRWSRVRERRAELTLRVQ